MADRGKTAGRRRSQPAEARPVEPREILQSPIESGDRLSSHILTTSANLVGVCIMSLSLVKLLPRHSWSAWADEALALDSLVFLASVALSYSSMRVRSHAIAFERWAEMLFLGGLFLVMLVCLVLAYGIN